MPLQQGRRNESADMLARTTKITIETEGLLVVRQGRTVVTWCPDCQAEVDVMLSGEDTSFAELLRGVPAGAVHQWRDRDGSTYLCLTSLLRFSQHNQASQMQNPERLLPEEGEKP